MPRWTVAQDRLILESVGSCDDQVAEGCKLAVTHSELSKYTWQQCRRRYYYLKESARRTPEPTRILWTLDERLAVHYWLSVYGKDFERIAEEIGSRTASQISSYVYRHYRRDSPEALELGLKRRERRRWLPANHGGAHDLVGDDDAH